MNTIDKINYYLFKQGKTGADLSRALGLSNSVYSQWNTGKTKPRKSKLIAIAEYLNVSVEDLLPDDDAEAISIKKRGISTKIEGANMVKSPIVARINALLAERGIEKKKFFADCKITSATYSQWNTGKTTPRMRNLAVIATYLGVPLDELLRSVNPSHGGISEDDEKKQRPAQGEALSPEKQAAWELLQKMDDDTLRRFINAAKAMLGE